VTTATAIVSEVFRRPETLPPSLRSPGTQGAVRLLCIDGPAGSGKTTLAAEVAEEHRSAVVVHMDDIFEGWEGLADAPRRVRTLILDPLRHGEPAAFRRYDWHRGALAETITLPPTDLLVLEGVGAGDRSYAEAITLLVYVTAPLRTRLSRGLERDGEQMRSQWLRWQEQEAVYLRDAQTELRADVVIEN